MHRLHEMARALGDTATAPTPGQYPATSSNPRGRVGLFLGCASAAQQGGALQAALRLLRHARYSVNIPSGGACCGALSQHSGDPAEAARLASENRDAFDDELDVVLSIASGCGTHIDSYQPALAAGHQDICRFLLECGGLSRADFSPLPNRVFLHTPCSVENVYRGSDWARGLLGLIPDLEIATAGEAGQCCGAAGDYMLRYPEIAARLREPILDELRPGTRQILLTSNVGCAMHLAGGLRNRGSDFEVLHPVELLAQQLIGGTGA
jgi:glycolate oxidase iron-sulfur subunit